MYWKSKCDITVDANLRETKIRIYQTILMYGAGIGVMNKVM